MVRIWRASRGLRWTTFGLFMVATSLLVHWNETGSPWGRAWQASKLEVMCNDVPPLKLRGSVE